MFSGAIRYYTSIAGVVPLGYLPKALMIVCIALALLQPLRPAYLIVACYLAAQACVALVNGVGPAAIGFWLWSVSPMLFAALTPPEALEELESPRMLFALIVLAALCNAGVILNSFTHMPWTGGRVDVDGVSVKLAVASYVGTASRLSGFGRGSAGTGLMIGLLAVWLLPRLRTRLAVAALLAVSAAGIWYTTNKTTLVALAIIVMFHYLMRAPGLRRACIWFLVLTIVLPLVGWVAAQSTNAGLSDSSTLMSMLDRFINTWPQLLDGMLSENLIWFGIGPGGFGAATIYYVSSFGFNVGYADNMALYMLANFGLIGSGMIAFVFVHYVLARHSSDARPWLMLSFLLLSSITTDIIETVGCLLFLGITLRMFALGPAAAVTPYVRRSRRTVPGTAAFAPTTPTEIKRRKTDLAR